MIIRLRSLRVPRTVSSAWVVYPEEPTEAPAPCLVGVPDRETTRRVQLSKTVIVIPSLAGGGAERQAILLFEGLRRFSDVVLVSLERRNEYLAEADPSVVFLGKEKRGDLMWLVGALRRHVAGATAVVAFGWYANTLAMLTGSRAKRIVRYGAPIAASVPRGVRQLMAAQAQRTSAAVVGLTWDLTRSACESLGSPRIACCAIGNGVDGGHLALAGPPDAAQAPILLVLSRLKQEKGVDRVIEAFVRCADRLPHSLVISGVGPAEAALRRQVADAGLSDRVEFRGFSAQPWHLLATADLVLVGSRWEGFGSTIVEALSCGTPVIAMDVPYGPRVILGDMPYDALVHDGDIDGFAERVCSMVGDSGRLASLSAPLKEVALARHSVDSMVTAYADLLSAVGGAWPVKVVEE